MSGAPEPPSGGFGGTGTDDADDEDDPGVRLCGVDRDRIAKAVREILEAIGEDPDRDGLRETPSRVARMYDEIFSGLRESPDHHLKVLFEAEHDEMIMVRDITVFSTCEHHLVPWFGKAHVAYIPNDDGRVTGLSKLARLVEAFARRPQVQERLTAQIADELDQTLQPRGVMVVVEAEHLCMSMRGIRKPGATTVTSAVRGLFRSSVATRQEAMRFINSTR
jgi:GTP cyclohydrolase I